MWQKQPTSDEVEAVVGLDISWHQRWEIAPGIFTPGRNDVAHLMDSCGVPDDLTGQRVLDVGAYNGCVAFEAERRGAADVVALDIMKPSATGFSQLADVLGSQAQWVPGAVYDLDPDVHGTFDSIFFFGVLYHLRYPHLALDRLRTVATDHLYVETHVIDNHWVHPNRFVRRLKRFELSRSKTAIWRQYRSYELVAEDPSNTFGPNTIAVVEALEDSGFETTDTTTWHDRAGFSAQVRPGPRRAEQIYEAQFPTTAALSGVDLVEDDPLFGD